MILLWEIDTEVEPAWLSLMQTAADCALWAEGVTRPCAVSVRLCDDEAIHEIAALAAEINEGIENIGARRLQTVMEKLLEEISFTASERSGEVITITPDVVRARVGELAKNADLTKFIL